MKKNLLLLFIAVISIIPLNAQLTQSFDAVTFPPGGWTNTHSRGTNNAAVWSRATAGALGGDLDPPGTFTVNPHSGAGMAAFRSYVFETGNGAHLVTSAVDLSAGGPHIISFWMFRDRTYPNPDSVSVYINTTPSVTGGSFLGKILRMKSLDPIEAGPDGWYQYSFNIPPSFNTATNYFIFSAVSGFGNNIFIDDVAVASAPACGTPVIGNITNFNSAAGTASVTLTPPAVGTTPSGYEWAVNATGTAPASGTAFSGTSLNITGITPGVVNFLYLRSNCGGTYSSWSNKPFAGLPCATIVSPTSGSTNVPSDQLFAWNTITGATNYHFFLGFSPGNEVSLGSTMGTSVALPGLLEPNTSYSWYILPSIGGIFSPATCASNTFTVMAEPNTPVNNTCAGAKNISAGNTAANPVSGTTLAATLSLIADDCNGFSGSSDDDVWYEFTTNAGAQAGTLTISPSGTDSISDIVALVYESTTCNGIGTLTTCADATSFGPEVVNLSGLTPNRHYYMRVFSWDEGPDYKGNFTIVASAGNTLPVQIASFTARSSNSVNILNWSTQLESNTNHFIIERSSDGRSFAGIGQVTAAGNSNTIRNYTFTDVHPIKGNNYYRLRTVDKDNTSGLSDIRIVKNDGVAAISIYPNPVHNRLSVSVSVDKAANGQLMITDMSGKTVYTKAVNIMAGNTILAVDLPNISSGSYIMKIQLNNDMILQKFNKQ